MDRFDVKNLHYDGNGNIQALISYKEDNSVIDQLNYSYTVGNNRLSSVTDDVNTTPEDWDVEDTQFSYDPNDNVIMVVENGAARFDTIDYDQRKCRCAL